MNLLTGCASTSGVENSDNVAQLTYGMSQQRVLSLLGTPDSVVKGAENDRWVYEYRNETKKGHNLFIDFKSGELAKTGELNGREIAAANESRTPGTCTKWVRHDFIQESLCTR